MYGGTGRAWKSKVFVLTWFNSNGAEQLVLRGSPQLLEILLSKLHSSDKKESVWQIRRAFQSKHMVGKQEPWPSLLRENLGERRPNPAQKILL